MTLRIVCASVSAAMLAAAGVVGLATVYPKLALALTAIGTGLLGLSVNLPGSKVP